MSCLNWMPKMVRVINNLLSNAIKYGHEDSVITMEVFKSDGCHYDCRWSPISKKYWNNSLYFYRAKASRSKKKPVEQDLVWRCRKHCTVAWRYDVCRIWKQTKQASDVCLPEENQGSLKQFKRKTPNNQKKACLLLVIFIHKDTRVVTMEGHVEEKYEINVECRRNSFGIK